MTGIATRLSLYKHREEERIKRLMTTRGWSQEELDRRENTQVRLDIKTRRADYIIDNDASEEETLSQVRRVISLIIQEDFDKRV